MFVQRCFRSFWFWLSAVFLAVLLTIIWKRARMEQAWRAQGDQFKETLRPRRAAIPMNNGAILLSNLMVKLPAPPPKLGRMSLFVGGEELQPLFHKEAVEVRNTPSSREGSQFRLYSVGLNGVDQGGTCAIPLALGAEQGIDLPFPRLSSKENSTN